MGVQVSTLEAVNAEWHKSADTPSKEEPLMNPMLTGRCDSVDAWHTH